MYRRVRPLIWIAALLILAAGCSSGLAIRQFEEAQEVDTIAAYERYLRKNPESQYAERAQERMAELRGQAEEHARDVAAEKQRLRRLFMAYEVGVTTYAEFRKEIDYSGGRTRHTGMEYEQGAAVTRSEVDSDFGLAGHVHVEHAASLGLTSEKIRIRHDDEPLCDLEFEGENVDSMVLVSLQLE